jgi:uncharacterized phosphosugar-binding protein
VWKKFADHISELIDELKKTQGQNIEKAAKIVSDSIETDGIVHTFGTGHSALIAQEIFSRAGGIVPVNAILDPSYLPSAGAMRSAALERIGETAPAALSGHEVRAGDVAIIISNSGRNAATVEMALLMKRLGVSIIAVTSIKHTESVSSNHPSQKRLFEAADVVIDNLGAIGDASMEVPGVVGPMGATSGIVGSLIVQGVIIEAAAILAGRGKPPAVLVSVNVDAGGLEELGKAILKYQGRIKHL